MKRYKLTNNKKVVDDKEVFQIEALVDSVFFKKGDLGGYIEDESCLSQDCSDYSWIFKDSVVLKDSIIEQGSIIAGNSKIISSHVSGNSRVINSEVVDTVLSSNSIVDENSICRSSTFLGKCIIKNSKITGLLLSNTSIYKSDLFKKEECLENIEISDSFIYGSTHKISHSYNNLYIMPELNGG